MTSQHHNTSNNNYQEVLQLFCSLSGHIQDRKIGFEFDGIDYAIVLNSCCVILEKLVDFGMKQQHQHHQERKQQDCSSSSFKIDLSKLCWITNPTNKQKEENMKCFLESAKNFSKVVCASQHRHHHATTRSEDAATTADGSLMYFFSLGNKNTLKKLPLFPGFDHDNNKNQNGKTANNLVVTTAASSVSVAAHQHRDNQKHNEERNDEDSAIVSVDIDDNNNNNHDIEQDVVVSSNNNDSNNNRENNRISLLLFTVETMQQDKNYFIHHMQVQKWLCSVFCYLMEEYVTVFVNSNTHGNNNSHQHLLQNNTSCSSLHYLFSTFQNHFFSNNSTCSSSSALLSPEQIRQKYREPIPTICRSSHELLELAELVMEEKKGYRRCWNDVEKCLFEMLESSGEVDWRRIQHVMNGSQPTRVIL